MCPLNKDDRENSLKERIKELEGLYGLSSLIEEQEDLEKIFDKFLKEILPASMQFPDKTVASIELGGKKYCSNKGKCTFKNFLSAEFDIGDNQKCKLKVGYSEDLPFIEKFEQNLINEYVKKLGYFIRNKKAEESLKEKIEELEKVNKIMVGRELEIIKLKRKIGELEDSKNFGL